MNVFYNKQGIGDTLLVSLKEIDKEKRGIDRKGNVARLYHLQSGETTGYNIFHASTYGDVSGKGILAVDESLVTTIKNALRDHDFSVDNISVPEEPPFVVGYVKEKQKHPDADKLSVCQVETGDKTLQIVCGAANVAKDQKVPVAVPGTVMPSGMKIKKSKLRGVPSSGMICSAKELFLADAPPEKGILVLDDSYETGADFLVQYQSRAE
ncbi:YtpR family tRNA-binding protein [Alteribacillus sp. HJP-4]|uniref:YtpR family tRNA-binding protein n=1 Tax=Alteribacillus sp. HJP-4 TaxID=2775394 RepID=UPI0035CCDC28